ncbi:hypothetical protein AQI96_11315 [Streptomyces canus]|nr:hypothetical protein AQI96_11315 [Streptomyces canus]
MLGQQLQAIATRSGVRPVQTAISSTLKSAPPCSSAGARWAATVWMSSVTTRFLVFQLIRSCSGVNSGAWTGRARSVGRRRVCAMSRSTSTIMVWPLLICRSSSSVRMLLCSSETSASAICWGMT